MFLNRDFIKGRYDTEKERIARDCRSQRDKARSIFYREFIIQLERLIRFEFDRRAFRKTRRETKSSSKTTKNKFGKQVLKGK